jgi:protein-disulfide isomerase
METEQTTNKYTVPLAIVVAGAMVAAAIFFGSGERVATSPNQSSPSIKVAPVSANDHVLGNRNAKLFIVEYSDIECPFCKVFHFTMKEVLAAYDNNVAWVYRHFPIPQLHANAIKEAEATECAAELGGNTAFWRYLDEIFLRTNSNDSLDLAELPKIASDIGLDVSAFSNCLASGRHTETVAKHMEEAVRAGARGTPYSVILDSKGKVVGTINGAEPFSSVKAKLDALLK